MNLDGVAKVGRSPWLPNDQASGLDVWHMDDVPTAGTFEFAGRSWLFAAVVDVEERTTVWGYVPLSAADLARVDALESAEAMQTFIDAMFVERDIVLAGADSFVIERWSRSKDAPSLIAAATGFIKDWVRTMRDSATEREQFNAFRAGADEYQRSSELTSV